MSIGLKHELNCTGPHQLRGDLYLLLAQHMTHKAHRAVIGQYADALEDTARNFREFADQIKAEDQS